MSVRDVKEKNKGTVQCINVGDTLLVFKKYKTRQQVKNFIFNILRRDLVKATPEFEDADSWESGKWIFLNTMYYPSYVVRISEELKNEVSEILVYLESEELPKGLNLELWNLNMQVMGMFSTSVKDWSLQCAYPANKQGIDILDFDFKSELKVDGTYCELCARSLNKSTGEEIYSLFIEDGELGYKELKGFYVDEPKGICCMNCGSDVKMVEIVEKEEE